MPSDPVTAAARLIASSDGLLITAGAGIGVDSGLPDFRGNEGFWKAYPALARAQLAFQSIANPATFVHTPRLAWGFYGHRLALYRNTLPHRGFALLLQFIERLPHGGFIVTSNVDGQFQKAGFSEEQLFEIHGSIHYLQCTTPCQESIWSAQGVRPQINEQRCEWENSSLPTCGNCGEIARPNILMFDDWTWIHTRSVSQRLHFQTWLETTKAPVIIEVGAGIELPAIRHISESRGYPLIRINPQHTGIPEHSGVSLPFGALKGLSLIAEALTRLGWLSKAL